MFKVGDKVKVLPSAEFTNPDFHNLEGEIVEIVNENKVMVFLPKAPYGTQPYEFRNPNERLQHISGGSISASGRQEKPCQVCKRNNDVGVSICWMCGNQPF
jgi:hypothetical protein